MSCLFGGLVPGIHSHMLSFYTRRMITLWLHFAMLCQDFVASIAEFKESTLHSSVAIY